MSGAYAWALIKNLQGIVRIQNFLYLVCAVADRHIDCTNGNNLAAIYERNGAPEVFITREVAYKSVLPRSCFKKLEVLTWFNFMTTQFSALY